MPTIYYDWDDLDDVIVAERDENGNIIAEYTHEPGYHGQLISQRRNGQSYYYHYDPDGNTVALTDDNGDVTDTYAYTAFGEVTERTGTTENPFQFKGAHGYYLDSFTGQYLFGGLNYDPARGRWLSANLLASLAQELNLYDFLVNAHEDSWSSDSPSGVKVGQTARMALAADVPTGNGTPGKKCECSEDTVRVGRVPLYTRIVDVELRENVDGTKNPVKEKIFVRKRPLVREGKRAVDVLLTTENYRVVCCKKDGEFRVLEIEHIDDAYRTQPVAVPTPPGPPTQDNMVKAAQCALPVPFWFFDPGSDDAKCLNQAIPAKFGPQSIPVGADLEKCSK